MPPSLFAIDTLTVTFLIAAGILLVILIAIFVQRQIFRLHHNSARREPNVIIAASHRLHAMDAFDRLEVMLTATNPSVLHRGHDETVAKYLTRLREHAELTEAWPQAVVEGVVGLYEHARHLASPAFGSDDLLRLRDAVDALITGVEANVDRLRAMRHAGESRTASGNNAQMEAGNRRRAAMNTGFGERKNGNDRSRAEGEALLRCV